MSNADWYAKKMGQPAPRREGTPPVQQQTHAPYAPPPAYAPIPHPEQSQNPNWENMSQDERHQAVLNTVPKEGPGSRDAKQCPECGGELLFSQRSSGLRQSNTYPAPHCFNCGWPMIQSGSIGGALGGG